MVKKIKVEPGLGHIIQPWTILLPLGSLQRSFEILKPIFFFGFVYFIKSFDTVPRKNLWNRLEEIKVPLELRASTLRMYENIISNFKNIEV
jgi:hypothetical protein